MAVWIVRLIILLAGLALAGFMIWQLFTGARMLDFDVETRGPLIVVVFSLLLLITLGSAVSFLLIVTWLQPFSWAHFWPLCPLSCGFVILNKRTFIGYTLFMV